LISKYCSIIGVTRDVASLAGVDSGGAGAGMDCGIVMGGGNYKISLAYPMALPPPGAFST
jgi:hypothetical protein